MGEMFFFVQTIYYYREDKGKKQALFFGNVSNFYSL